MKDNLIVDLTYQFALQVIDLCKSIRTKKEYELASQLWRAGTSIGANVEEAQAGQSRADFRSKMSIAAKEARETHYWLRLARDAKVLSLEQLAPALECAGQIQRILTSIVKSTSENPKSII